MNDQPNIDAGSPYEKAQDIYTGAKAPLKRSQKLKGWIYHSKKKKNKKKKKKRINLEYHSTKG